MSINSHSRLYWSSYQHIPSAFVEDYCDWILAEALKIDRWLLTDEHPPDMAQARCCQPD